MGNSPSGWLPPPYGPLTPQPFTGWCAVDLLNPATNYNGMYGLKYVDNGAGLPAQEFRWYGACAPIPAGTLVRGLVFALLGGSLTLRCNSFNNVFVTFAQIDLYAIQTAFNPATLTWAGVAGLTTQLMPSPKLVCRPQPGGATDVTDWVSTGIVSGGLNMLGITYGFGLTVWAISSPTPAAIFDPAGLVIAPAPGISNWRILM